MILRALIVDDEYPARQELRYLLEQLGLVEIVGEAAGSSEALKLIQALEYDILFLDIKLPGISGLDLAAKIQNMSQKPHVVFITAYDNYALDAFDLDAVDYLLKPIEKHRLKRAIEKVITQISNSDWKVSPEKGKHDFHADLAEGYSGQEDITTGRIIAYQGDKMILIDVNNICYAFTEGDMVYIKTFENRFLTRFTLKELESRLPKNNFFRTHRSYLVNIYKVKEIYPFFNGTYLLVVEDKEKSEVPVSRIQGKKLRQILGC